MKRKQIFFFKVKLFTRNKLFLFHSKKNVYFRFISVYHHFYFQRFKICINCEIIYDNFRFSGERLIQFASENLVTEILIHPQYNTLIQCMRNLLSSFTRHRHIIHSGYAFSGNGSWILQVNQSKFID